MLRIALLAATLAVTGSASHRVAIPAGSYEPLYARVGEARIRIAAFAIDREPATRGQFEVFVRENPAWRRDAIRPVFAERTYLSDWTTPTEVEPATRHLPVTDVSWFAAKAYCAWRGGRLPTTDEWEYVAAASRTSRDASHDAARIAELVALYGARAGRGPGAIGHTSPNAFGVSMLHESIWEWTSDFNSVLVSDDSRTLGAGGDERDHHLFCASSAIGATDPANYAAFLRYAFRAGLTGRTTVRSLGFRCASAS